MCAGLYGYVKIDRVCKFTTILKDPRTIPKSRVATILTYYKISREEGDIGLFITLVPKVL